ncbi:MAG: hydantoinase/oxoprolinase family protein [Dehalococcoidia bacterium]|nr:hydantoinase/oxoprolinase family protein [Dehalococcoidia bacterium]
MKYRVGVDVGGTFTDLVAIDEKGMMKISKVPSTPDDSSVGIMNSVARAGVDLRDATFFAHGATVGANTIIEHKGVRTAIVTTKGFRDNLELRRGQRVIYNPTDMYNLQMDLPQDYVGGYDPLVRRPCRFEVNERLDHRGNVIKELNEAEVRAIARELRAKDVKAVAICYIFSFLNPKHEQRTAEILREMLPGVAISLSSEILPVIREYERLSTTTLNAYIMPIMQSYIRNLRSKLSAAGFSREFYIMQSSGGIMSSEVAGQRPVYTIDSGPAGGVSAAADLGILIGYPNVIAFDMGGTTTKVCVIKDGKPSVTTEFYTDGKYFSGAPIMDMVEIGAGGGSIVWLDAANSVHVGPQSAGAKPGPACYRMGGTEPTITDTDMVLGYINSDYFLGGDMKVDIELARAAIRKSAADKLGMSLTDAAYGIYRLVNANMIGAMRVVTVQRGYDPRDFTLVAFGGTAPVHSVRMAQELRIPRVVVPMAPGCFSALGLITADARYDVFRSYVVRTTKADPEHMQAIYDEMKTEALKKIEELGFKKAEITLKYGVAMRYEGQAHEVTIEIPQEIARRKVTEKSLKKIEALFHERHKYLYGHSSPEAPCEFFTLSVSATGPIPKAQTYEIEKGTASPQQAFKKDRKVYFEEFKDYVDCPTYERSLLKAGNVINGPAIIEQMDTTTVVPPRQKARIDKYGNIIIEVKT